MRKFLLAFLFLSLSFVGFAKSNDEGIGIGAEAAFPEIKKILTIIEFPKNQIYEVKDAELELLLAKSAEIEINLFELLNASYRYLNANNFRVKIKGASLRALTNKFCIAEGTMAKLLPIEKIDFLETGAVFGNEQNALDVFLTSKHSSDLELGIGFYEKHFGFKKISSLLFSECFGLKVKTKVLAITKQASKLELYQNGKGAFYVKGFFKPKRWNLSLIRKLN
ncbi:MAG: hypothetical protein P1P64_08135 [Treponemataceae bacterium]